MCAPRSWRYCVLAVALIAVGAQAACGQRIESIEFRAERSVERSIVHALRAAAAPTVDGVLDEPWWEGAVVSEEFRFGGGTAANAASLRVAFDDANLYLAAVFGVQDAAVPRREIPAEVYDDGNVWGDDCIDFKLSADGGATILQFLANANGARADTRNGGFEWNAQWSCAASIAEGVWRLEIAIPLAEIGISAPQPGMSLLFTCGRNDRETRQLTTAFGEQYGDVMKAAELVLGTAEEHAARASDLKLTRETTLALYLDRDQYPSFEREGTGRLRITSSNAGAAIEGEPTVEIALLRNGRQLDARTASPLRSLALDFDWRLADLEPGAYAIEARVSDDAGAFATAREEFVIERATVERSGRLPITVTPVPTELAGWPITVGVPFPWGALDSGDNIRLLDEAGAEVPVQVAVTGRWSRRGSVRWLLLDFIPPVGGAPRAYTLQYGPEVRRTEVVQPVVMEDGEAEVALTSGPLRLVVPRSNPTAETQVWLDSDGDGQFTDAERMLSPRDGFGPLMTDDAGVTYLGARDPGAEVALEEAGPIRACVRISGWHVAETGERLGQWIVRLYAYRGLPYLRALHTFIITADSDEARYRDIAWSLPFASSQYFLGTPAISAGRVADPGAYLLQRDDLCYEVYEGGAFKEEGEKAEGWMTVGGPGRFLTLAVKDLWQQFPKELEVTPGAVTVHFWPAHGEAPIRTGANLSIRNVYQQWFAHEGPVLDFTVPEEALQYVKQDSEAYNYPHARVANAIGLAKTHEMLLYFHRRDPETDRAREVNRVFQEAPTAVVDPQWVCASGVFGNMQPRDEAAFPTVERALDDTIGNIMRLQVMDRDFGMFNYGDAHHNWDWATRRWNLHRIWRNTHHGWTRWPWLMYARSGDKRLLDWANANARHVADVDHCHYATPDLEAQTYPLQKLVGGICDYKGFVHWASGGRLGYNSAADAMLWHWYMTGDRRSLTTALEHGAALITDGKPQPHREGSGRATSAAELYYATWDNDYLEFLERTADTLLDTQAEDGSFPQWENFAPWMQRYIDLTRSRRAMDAMARWADWIAAQPNPASGYHAKINILAHAYLYTGDEKYLRAAAWHVSSFADYVYCGPDPRYQGQFIVQHTNLDQSYFIQEAPYYLAALTRLGREPEPLRPTITSIRALSRESIDGEQRYVFDASLRQTTEGPLALDIAVSGYAGAAYTAELTPAGGAPVRVEGAPEHQDQATVLHLEVPADNEVEYELRVLCAQNFFVTVPIAADQPDLGEVYPIFREGTWVGDGFRFYFDLPAGTEQFALRYKGRSWPLQINIHDPRGEIVSTDTWIGSTDLNERSQRVSVDGRGPTGWSFTVNGYGQACVTGFEVSPAVEGHQFHFAVSPRKLFVPR